MVNYVANQPTPDRKYSTKTDASVLPSEPQFFVGIDSAARVEEMENAIWQNIGAHEIISLVRRDLIDGVNVNYSLVSNLKKLQEEYNPSTIFSIENISVNSFENFGLRLENYIPSIRALEQISPNITKPVVENPSGSGIAIYVENISEDQEVEVQVISSGNIFRDTIY